ncbi:MAG: protein kinase [Acidobacteriia bacterium]|nr:protein kinase [Terriglobia bacterium]
MSSPVLQRSPLIGLALGHYRILEKIGQGSMGDVYLARDEHLDRQVAIKVLPAGTFSDESTRKRFHQEALFLSQINHPGIATIYDFDTQENIDFLVTEYIPGVSLSEKLAQGLLAEGEILPLALQLVSALLAAHSHGLIHRDLKPSNLRLMPDGRLKLLDFGLAQSLPSVSGTGSTGSTDNTSGSFAGTLCYMPPEQFQGQPPDARSDIYAVGVILYEMATGHRPFEQKLLTSFSEAVLHQRPPAPRGLRPDLSPRLEQILLRCLEKNPEFRYQSCADLLADLKRAAIPDTQAESSLAVLYFENLAGRPEEEYFRDGITEDITTELSRINGLRVFSRSAVLPYRDKPVTPFQLGIQLGASHVLEGSLRREGDHLRITAKLVETRNAHCLWAERYDRQISDVFAIQDEIASNIARSLRLVLSDQDRRAIEKLPTADINAYDFYLRGRQFFRQFRRKGFDFARQMFARAIEIDPAYARAYAGIADCSAFLYMYWDSTADNLRQADEASRKALELDPDLAEAHASRGLTASLQKQYAEAERELQIAIRLGPKLFEPYYFLARSCYAQGKLKEAATWFERASAGYPEDYQAPLLLASSLRGLGRLQEAEAAYRRGLLAAEKHLELHPDDARALYLGAIALSQLGDKPRSSEWAERALAMEPDEPQVLYNVACVYALLEEAEKALTCLEKSVTRCWGQREWMQHDPDLALLRGHPRFQAILKSR